MTINTASGLQKLLIGLLAFWTLILIMRTGIGVGFGNNGDFFRVSHPSKIAATDAESLVKESEMFDYVVRFYPYKEPAPIPNKAGYSLADYFVWVALKLQRFALGVTYYPSVFAIASLSTLYLFTLFLGIWNLRKNLVSLGPFVALFWVFCDPYYSGYLNTFYAEPLGIVGLLLFSVSSLLLSSSGNPLKLPYESWNSTLSVWAGSTLLITGAKVQYLYFPVFALLSLFWLWKKRRLALPLAKRTGVVLVIGWLFMCFVVIRKSDRLYSGPINEYHSLFYGALTAVKNPDKYLEGSPFGKESQQKIGLSFWQAQPTEEFRKTLKKEGRKLQLKIYFSEPIRMITKLFTEAYTAFQQPNIWYFGQLPRAFGERQQVCSIVDYCSLRNKIWSLSWGAVFYFSPILLGVIFSLWVDLGFLPLILGLFGISQIFISFMGDGFYEFQKHLLLSRLSFDFIWVGAIITLISIVLKRLTPAKH